jgi:hypothetical protein
VKKWEEWRVFQEDGKEHRDGGLRGSQESD